MPSKRWLSGRSWGIRSFARSVFSLGQGEIFGEPAVDLHAVDRLAGLAIGEFPVLGDIRRLRDLVLVTGDENAVSRHHQIRFDEVGAHLYRKRIGGQRMLGHIAAGAAMSDDERPVGPDAWHGSCCAEDEIVWQT